MRTQRRGRLRRGRRRVRPQRRRRPPPGGRALGRGAQHGRDRGPRDRGRADAQWDVAPGFWSTIGEHTLKYVAWGDGFDEARLVDHGDGAWTVWYGTEGRTVGVLTHERDEDYESGRERVETGGPLP